LSPLLAMLMTVEEEPCAMEDIGRLKTSSSSCAGSPRRESVTSTCSPVAGGKPAGKGPRLRPHAGAFLAYLAYLLRGQGGGANAGGARTRGDNGWAQLWPPALAGMEHERSVLGSAQPVSQKLPFLHILIANAKGILRGGHHGVRRLWPYLSEFRLRFFHCNFEAELAWRLLCACLGCGPQPGRSLRMAA